MLERHRLPKTYRECGQMMLKGIAERFTANMLTIGATSAVFWSTNRESIETMRRIEKMLDAFEREDAPRIKSLLEDLERKRKSRFPWA